MNKILLTGRIANELELKRTNNNKYVITFNLAVNRDKENTDFIRITAFEGSAKLIKEYCIKGDLIGIEGSLRVDTYVDKEGKNKNMVYVLVNKVEFLQPKKKDAFEEMAEKVANDNSYELPF